MIYVFDTAETIVGKEENAGIHHFPFPKIISKAFFRIVKIGMMR